MRTIEYEGTTDRGEYEITIEANPDHWRGGFVWSVSFGDEEVGCGLEFTRQIARDVAKKQVIYLMYKNDVHIAKRDL